MMWEPLHMSLDEIARNNESLILQRLASVGQSTLAQRIGVSESTISRFKDNEIERISKMLIELGLKIVPAGTKTYRPELIDAVFTLAKDSMNRVESMGEFSEF